MGMPTRCTYCTSVIYDQYDGVMYDVSCMMYLYHICAPLRHECVRVGVDLLEHLIVLVDDSHGQKDTRAGPDGPHKIS
jgi:hypothetical protein